MAYRINFPQTDTGQDTVDDESSGVLSIVDCVAGRAGQSQELPLAVSPCSDFAVLLVAQVGRRSCDACIMLNVQTTML